MISIHALREESDQSFLAPHVIDGEISIHVLREESDGWVPRSNAPPPISIHVLREESD